MKDVVVMTEKINSLLGVEDRFTPHSGPKGSPRIVLNALI